MSSWHAPRTRTITFPLVVALQLALGAGPALAADFYVRPDGGDYGAEDGADWDNAFDGFGDIAWGDVAAGDTIWVAGGTYNEALAPQQSGTAGAVLAIRRARGDATACTGAAGWSASFDATVHQVKATIVVNSVDYVTISGRTASGEHGWWIDFKGTNAGVGIAFPNDSTASYNTFEYIDIEGAGNIDITWQVGSESRAIDASSFSSATGNVFSHLKIWDWAEGAVVAGMSAPVFEHVEMFDLGAANWQQFHPNGIIILGGANPDGVVRYCRFHRGPDGLGVGEGIFFEQSSGGSNGWRIHGNLFYDLDHEGWKAIEITTPVTDLRIYNNTFDNIGPLPAIYNTGGATGETKNNLFHAVAGAGEVGTASNNLVADSPDVFVDRANKDYRIVETIGAGYPRDAGAALAADGFIDKDAHGNTRGADGSWDIGAYEYATGGGDDAAASDGAHLDAAAGGDGGSQGDAGVTDDADDGCGCGAGRLPAAGSAAPWLALLLCAALARRRRRGSGSRRT